MIRLTQIETAYGPMAFVYRDETLIRSYLPDTAKGLQARMALDPPPDRVVSRFPSGLRPLRELVLAYFEGAPVDPAAIEVPLDHGPVSAFTHDVLEALRGVPRGMTTSYGRLAARAGRPKAARAVGGAMARNRLPLIVPCHRVLAAQGRVGGFSGPGGLTGKRLLLGLEGVDLPAESVQGSLLPAE